MDELIIEVIKRILEERYKVEFEKGEKYEKNTKN